MARRAGNRDDILRASRLKLLCDVGHQFRVKQIALVERDNLGLFIQGRAIFAQFVTHNVPSGHGVILRCINQVNEDPAALNMAQETVANANAFGSASDKAWNIGQHEFTRLMVNNAQLRARGGERIIANLRLGIRHLVDERRFARVRHADKAHISQQFQPQPDISFFAGPTWTMFARGAVG